MKTTALVGAVLALSAVIANGANFANVKRVSAASGLGSIGNRVWFDTNNNGQIDPTETGVPGVSLSALDPNGATVASAFTNVNGYYRFDDLPFGDYRIRVEPVSLSQPTDNQPVGVLKGWVPSWNAEDFPNNRSDDDSNGPVQCFSPYYGVTSGIVTLNDQSPLNEPQDPTEPAGNAVDSESNLTVDFGFTQLPKQPQQRSDGPTFQQKDFVVGTYIGPSLTTYAADRRSFLPGDAVEDKRRLTEMKDAGFNLIVRNFDSILPSDQIKRELGLAAEVGVKYLIADNRVAIPTAGNGHADLAAATAVVDDYKNLPQNLRDAIYGYDLGDEPCSAYPAMKEWVAHVHQNDPTKLAYTNLLPKHGFVNNLEYQAYIDSIYPTTGDRSQVPDVITTDYYPLLSTSAYNHYFYNIRTIAERSRALNIPFWTYPISVQDTAEYRPVDESYLRFQSFVPVAYGAKGLVYYTYGTFGYCDVNDSATCDGVPPKQVPTNGVACGAVLKVVCRFYGDAVIKFDHVTKTPTYFWAQKINGYLRDVVGPASMQSEFLGVFHQRDFEFTGYNQGNTPNPPGTPSTGVWEAIPSQERLTAASPIVDSFSDSQSNSMVSVFHDKIDREMFYLLVVNRGYEGSALDVTLNLKGNFTGNVHETSIDSPTPTPMAATFDGTTTQVLTSGVAPGEGRLIKLRVAAPRSETTTTTVAETTTTTTVPSSSTTTTTTSAPTSTTTSSTPPDEPSTTTIPSTTLTTTSASPTTTTTTTTSTSTSTAPTSTTTTTTAPTTTKETTTSTSTTLATTTSTTALSATITTTTRPTTSTSTSTSTSTIPASTTTTTSKLDALNPQSPLKTNGGTSSGDQTPSSVSAAASSVQKPPLSFPTQPAPLSRTETVSSVTNLVPEASTPSTPSTNVASPSTTALPSNRIEKQATATTIAERSTVLRTVVSGKVWIDQNSNRVQEANETANAGVEIEFTALDGTKFSAKTNASGRYELALPEGTYRQELTGVGVSPTLRSKMPSPRTVTVLGEQIEAPSVGIQTKSITELSFTGSGTADLLATSLLLLSLGLFAAMIRRPKDNSSDSESN
jgi:SdrD B-like domain